MSAYPGEQARAQNRAAFAAVGAQVVIYALTVYGESIEPG